MSSEPTGSSTVFDFLAWLEVNKKRLAIGAVVATVVGFGIAAYRHHQNAKEMEASSALLQIKTPATARGSTNLPTATDYLRVSAQYSGTDAAERAALLGAGALYGSERYEEARQAFESFLKDYPSSPWVADAAFGKAVSLDALDKTNEAMAAYQDIITRHGDSPVVAQAQLGLARLQEALGKPDQALKIYQELTKVGAASAWAPEAASRKEQLLSKFPELAKTLTPPVVTNAPAVAPLPGAAATNR